MYGLWEIFLFFRRTDHPLCPTSCLAPALDPPLPAQPLVFLNKAREDLGWLGSWVPVRTQRETFCSESRLPRKEIHKYRIDCSQELFPFPAFCRGGGGTWQPLRPLLASSLTPLPGLGGRAGVEIGEKGAGAGGPPDAGLQNWPTGPG